MQENSLKQQGIDAFKKDIYLILTHNSLLKLVMGRLGWAEIMRKEICQTLPH